MKEKPLIKTDKKGRFVKGTVGGPGRPKGSLSVIGKLKQKWEENPEDFEKFVDEYREDPASRKHITEMVDGKPKQNIGVEGDLSLTVQFANEFNKNE